MAPPRADNVDDNWVATVVVVIAHENIQMAVLLVAEMVGSVEGLACFPRQDYEWDNLWQDARAVHRYDSPYVKGML